MFVRKLHKSFDLFLAWILWGPTRLSLILSFVVGARLGILPRFAGRSLKRAMKLKLYRTAVEILTLSDITISVYRVDRLLEECMRRGYFARASLLSKYLSTEKREKLIAWLLACDELDLATAVAVVSEKQIPEHTAAYIALRRRAPSKRARVFRDRILSLNTQHHTARTDVGPSTTLH
jgi:hypothetical protein